MNTPDLLQRAKELLEPQAPGGVRVDRFEVVDEVAELAASFHESVLGNVLASELAVTGGPSDWDDPDAPLDEGSPTWGYATEMATLLNHDYFNRVILTQHGPALERLLAEHGHPGVPVVASPGYTPAVLMPYYRRLKAGRTPRRTPPQD